MSESTQPPPASATSPQAAAVIADQYFTDLRAVMQRNCETHGRPTQCYELAQFYERVDKDMAKANAIYEDLCRSRTYAKACFSEGLSHLLGRGYVENRAKALECFLKACYKGDADSCNNAGMIYRKGGSVVAEDSAKAADFFEKGCALDSRNSCYMASVVHLIGGNNLPVNKARAAHFAEEACRQGHTWGCVNAARLFATGDGVPKDETRAAQLRARAQELIKTETTVVE
eukprot:m.66203 g.66203  ORF g.66203 m.66203 type:complete len:230 (+) comp49861_c0_seq2:84-773(+)